jgi:GLPGLI family protein
MKYILTVKKQIIIFCALLSFAALSLAQPVLMKYNNELFASSQGVSMGEKYVFIPDEKYSVIFTLPISDSIDQWIDNGHALFFVRAMDTKREKYRELMFALKKDTGGYKTEYFSKSEWQAFSKLHEFNESDREMMSAAIGRDVPERNLQIAETSDTRKIKDYECRRALVQMHGDTFEVWYSQNNDYSHYFDNYYREIPGLVVQVTKGNENRQELMEFVTLPEMPFFTEKQINDMVKKH